MVLIDNDALSNLTPGKLEKKLVPNSTELRFPKSIPKWTVTMIAICIRAAYRPYYRYGHHEYRSNG